MGSLSLLQCHSSLMTLPRAQATVADLSGRVQVPPLLCHQHCRASSGSFHFSCGVVLLSGARRQARLRPSAQRGPPQQRAHLATNEALLAPLVLARLVTGGGQAARPSPGAHRPPARPNLFLSTQSSLPRAGRPRRERLRARGERGTVGASTDRAGLGGSAQTVPGHAVGSVCQDSRVVIIRAEAASKGEACSGQQAELAQDRKHDRWVTTGGMEEALRLWGRQGGMSSSGRCGCMHISSRQHRASATWSLQMLPDGCRIPKGFGLGWAELVLDWSRWRPDAQGRARFPLRPVGGTASGARALPYWRQKSS